MVLLRRVDKREAIELMKEIHEGTFGTHPNEYSMAKRLLRAGYYWLTMESDCCVSFPFHFLSFISFKTHERPLNY